MSKRIQVVLTDEATEKLDGLCLKAKEFKSGCIKISDLVSEIIVQSEIDIEDLKYKYTSLKKSLISLAHANNLDIDLAIKTLSEMKNKKGKKQAKPTQKSFEEEA